MEEQIPAGAIPAEDFKPDQVTPANPSPVAQQTGAVPPGAIPVEDFKSDSDKYGTPSEIFKTALEQGASGATLGLSKVAETKLFGVNPEDIAGREAANPGTSFTTNVLGGAGAIAATGGIGALGKVATVGGRLALGALEGATFGGVNQATDDWSQNKPLDAQKIAASAGIGSLLGLAGAGIGEGIRAKFGAAEGAESSGNTPPPGGGAGGGSGSGSGGGGSPVVEAPKPEFKGVQPTTYEDIANRVNEAKTSGNAIPLPAQAELDGALSRVGMENPVNPLQRDSLSSQEARDIYKTAKETPGSVGPIMNNYEAVQKAELVGKTAKTIQELSPGYEPTADSYKGGRYAVGVFSDQYQAENAASSPIFKYLKGLPSDVDLLPEAVSRMSNAVPGVASMFDTAGAELAIKPYKTSWGIDKATYNAVKDAIEGLKEDPHSIEGLWNVRKGLTQNIDTQAQGQAPSEIRRLKASLMDLMQDASKNTEVRDYFKRYAINEQNREVIEKSFGASVGTPEFGAISKVKPEMIGDNIFKNTATVEAAQKILPKEQFNNILANWISEAKEAATDKGAFSSNKFGTFLRRNKDALNIAFQDNPQILQRLKDLTTIMRILPDDVSINPSGSAKTAVRMVLDKLGEGSTHNLTWEGMIASLPKKIAKELNESLKMKDLNKALADQSVVNAQNMIFKKKVQATSNLIENGVKSIFSSTAGVSRKTQDGK